MKANWVFEPLPSQQDISELSKSINVNTYISALLIQRTIRTFEQAKAFFRPSLDNLLDPFEMKDMDKAVVRLQKAIQNKEKILIYGDYDVDGTTSVALVYGFLKEFYDNLLYYTPDRYLEGYGVSQKGIEWAAQQDVQLVIALDCGIKANEEVDFAKQKGIDFIICDHHRPEDSLPKAVAVLDPKRNDCPYPYKELSGCGIGFKFLQAFCQKDNIDLEKLYQHLDLVALSISADIVPITGENRLLAAIGLEKINQNARSGILALIEKAQLRLPIKVSNIVFGIAPRINAVGRLAHANAAIDLLLAKNMEDARRLADSAENHNDERRGFDLEATEEAVLMIKKNKTGYTNVLFKNNWHKGIIGIVASRCIEHEYRPTIILTESNGKATGSARSVKDFDIYEAISECADLLEQYGGHQYAAGLTMPLENIVPFREKFERVVQQKIKPEQLIRQIEVDLEIPLAAINQKFYDILKQMEPFGPKNMQPVFVTRNVEPFSVKLLKDKHLKMQVKQGNKYMEAIGFDMATHHKRIIQGENFDICYVVTENEYMGYKNLQLMLKAIHFKNDT